MLNAEKSNRKKISLIQCSILQQNPLILSYLYVNKIEIITSSHIYNKKSHILPDIFHFNMCLFLCYVHIVTEYAMQ